MPLRRKPRTTFRKKTYTRRRTTARRRPGTRRRKVVNNSKVIVFKSAHNAILPDEYFCKLRTRYQFAVAAASFAAVGGTAGNYQLVLKASDPYLPFSLFPGAGITWMAGVNPVSGASHAQDFTTLCNLTHYLQCLVVAAKTRVRLAYSATASNDAMLVTITPNTVNPGTTPADAARAQLQKETRYKEFAGTNLSGQKLSCFTKFHRLLGTDKRTFMADPQIAYSATYNASPTTLIYHTINMATLDCAAPSNPVGIEVELVQYVKMYRFTAAQIAP